MVRYTVNCAVKPYRTNHHLFACTLDHILFVRYESKDGPGFNQQMSIYMKQLDASTKKWSDKDEAQLQSALQKTGLDLSQKPVDVMKRPNVRTKSRTAR
jgi:hypothetical protein